MTGNPSGRSTDAVAKDLGQVARGGAYYSIGTIASMLIQFAAGVLLVRVLTVGEYGDFSLANSTVTLLAMISLIGFQNGLSRFVVRSSSQPGYHRGTAVATPLVVSAITSMVMTIVIFAGAGLIAEFFAKPALETVFRYLSTTILPMALIRTLNAVFRGLQDQRAKVLFDDISFNTSRLVFLGFVFVFGMHFEAVLIVYVLATWVSLIAYTCYFLRHAPGGDALRFDWKYAGELVRFCVPLLGFAVLSNLMIWLISAILGFYHVSEQVALFTAPQRLTNFVPVPLLSLAYMYLPIASTLTTPEDREALAGLYRSVTRWAFWITFPALLYLVFDAEFLLRTIFGEKYLPATNVLRALALGSAFHTFLGPNGMTLIALGESKAIFYSSLISAIVALCLGLLLVPGSGALGAAIALALAGSLSNTFVSVVLYARYRLHPFAIGYLRPLLITGVVGGGLAMVLRRMGVDSFGFLLIFLPSVLLTLVVTVILTEGFDESDRTRFKRVRKRLGW